MKNMSHKTNKKRGKLSKRNKRSRRSKRTRRNKQSRINRRQRGGNYNAEQIQQITDTIKANNNLIDITDEEITQFINKINPNAAIVANVYQGHSRFHHLLDAIQGIVTREELQEFGDNIADFITGADNTDFESDPED
jgi:hypothetical protein